MTTHTQAMMSFHPEPTSNLPPKNIFIYSQSSIYPPLRFTSEAEHDQGDDEPLIYLTKHNNTYLSRTPPHQVQLEESPSIDI